jgi:diadenosine tetraphosphate (Ap4A) HIT family hydrolase
VPGNLFLILKRHAEQLAELTSDEAASLGPLIQNVCAALTEALHPVKIYVASYGEGVRHIHFHLIPRTLAMPLGMERCFSLNNGEGCSISLG